MEDELGRLEVEAEFAVLDEEEGKKEKKKTKNFGGRLWMALSVLELK